MVKLTVKSGTKVIKTILLNKPSFRVGRLNDNDLVLPDNLASRYHCEITLHNNKYILTDLRSANGTMVNRKKVITHSLEDNDEIQIDAYTIVFQEGSTFMPSGAPARFGPTPVPTPGASPLTGATASGNNIVKHLNDIDASYQINIKDILKKGESLSSSVMAGGLQETKEGKKFFLLYQMGKAVATAASLQEVLDIAITSVFDFVNAERGVIMLLDRKSNQLEPKISRYRDRKEMSEHFRVSRTIINKVVRDKVSIVSSDAMADARFDSGASIAQQNIRSALCVPLWEKDEVLGVIYIDNLMSSHCFTDENLDLMTAIANQIAIRIKQEELYETLRKEAIVRTNLERYHSPDVAEMIISQGVTLDVQEKDVTVLFADIQNFTTLSEKLLPSEIAAMLNNFFETTTHVVFEHKGSINKYIGDSVLAVFGAPVALPDHPAQAVMAAVKMLEALAAPQFKAPYNIRVGVNTGLVVAGNVGSQKRVEYTVVGDTVNVASRLNQYGKANEVIIGEETYQRIKDAGLPVVYKSLGAAKLKGKEKEVHVYQVSLVPEKKRGLMPETQMTHK